MVAKPSSAIPAMSTAINRFIIILSSVGSFGCQEPEPCLSPANSTAWIYRTRSIAPSKFILRTYYVFTNRRHTAVDSLPRKGREKYRVMAVVQKSPPHRLELQHRSRRDVAIGSRCMIELFLVPAK